MAKRKITITFGEKVYRLSTDVDKVTKSTLIDNFKTCGVLIYEDDNKEECLLQTDGDYIFLEDDVENYIYKETCDTAKKPKVWESMLNKINEKFQCGNQGKKLTQEKIGAKSINEMKNKEKPFLKRVIYIRWRHKSKIEADFEDLGSKIAPTLKIELDGNKKYSVNSLKSLILKKYINDKNDTYFKSSMKDLAYEKSGEFKIIHSLTDPDGNECNFWEFVQKHSLRNSSRHIPLFLLTTKTTQSTKERSEEKMNELDEESNCKEKQKDIEERKRPPDNSLVPANGTVDKFCHQKTVMKKRKIESIIDSDKLLELLPDCKTLVEAKKNEADNVFLKPIEPWKKDIHKLNLSIDIVEEDSIQLTSELLGKGGQGAVYKGKFCGSDVAVKVISKGLVDKHVLKEIKLLDGIHHSNIIIIMAVCVTQTQYLLVTEYFQSKNLHDIIFKEEIKKQFLLTNSRKMSISKQISSALTYLHSRKAVIIHRDVKPHNILVNKFYQAKLCDLGIGRCESLDTTLVTSKGVMCGTFSYMSPEVVYRQVATVKSDVWSYACTILELFQETPVWDASAYYDMYDCVRSKYKEKEVPVMEKLPISLKSKIKACFAYEPEKRPSMFELNNLF